MAGGVHSAGSKPVAGPCPFCLGDLEVKSCEWTGGPTGWTAAVECWGCDMRGPGSPYVYETEEEAMTIAVACFNHEPEALAELRGKFTPPRS
jgi:hypothetical protein